MIVTNASNFPLSHQPLLPLPLPTPLPDLLQSILAKMGRMGVTKMKVAFALKSLVHGTGHVAVQLAMCVHAAVAMSMQSTPA
jgi:hypothetical protein